MMLRTLDPDRLRHLGEALCVPDEVQEYRIAPKGD